MKNDLFIKNGITIPDHELEITASRAGGPGGQHVNKTSSKITIRWNIKKSSALNDEQKIRVIDKLQARLTADGDLIVHNSSTRSQEQNKKLALDRLSHEIRQALHVPKKRMAVTVSKSLKEARLKEKARRSMTKKLRSKKIQEY